MRSFTVRKITFYTCDKFDRHRVYLSSSSYFRNDVQDLVERASFKIYGSSKHSKLRRHHINVFSEVVRAGLREKMRDDNIDDNDFLDTAGTKKLEADLGRGANQGIMPDFSNKKTLRGYTLNHFGRCRLLSDLVTQTKPDWLSSRVSELFGRNTKKHATISTGTPVSSPGNDNNFLIHTVSCKRNDDISVASLGGGCGYDFVAISALSDFLRGPRIQATVYEYEPAWKNIVADVETIVRANCSNNDGNTNDVTGPQRQHECGFELCDITSALDASTNEAIASVVDSTNIFSCSYVVAENAVKLRQNKFEFFRQLFLEASNGSLFFFTETTHRLWPEFIDLAQRCSIRVSTRHIRCGKAGWQLVLLKDSAAGSSNSNSLISVEERELYERFKRDNIAHLLRLDRGWKRDERKERGVK
mmetsp:Transcript_23313/g.26127  ORF Transcript_23313/g.26127 Transcript_23313/m.26127 type:complete len:416 (-) Transcript_23313:244-1491(-)